MALRGCLRRPCSTSCRTLRWYGPLTVVCRLASVIPVAAAKAVSADALISDRTHTVQDCREFILWEVVLRWAQPASNSGGSPESGRELAEIEQALPLIRFPLMSEAELDAIASHPLACTCGLLAELLAEARAAHADAARAQELQVCRVLRHVPLPANERPQQSVMAAIASRQCWPCRWNSCTRHAADSRLVPVACHLLGCA